MVWKRATVGRKTRVGGVSFSRFNVLKAKAPTNREALCEKLFASSDDAVWLVGIF